MTAKRFTSDYNGDEHLLTHFLNNGKPMTKGEVLNQLNEMEKEIAFLTVEVEALKQIKPIRKLPQELTVLKLNDGDVE